ncbi:MAG: hypothetical protein K6T83_04530 [Alicyclobacillus sp.]|nr:hypothetical protein [Alicyclobacillus sp.]
MPNHCLRRLDRIEDRLAERDRKTGELLRALQEAKEEAAKKRKGLFGWIRRG